MLQPRQRVTAPHHFLVRYVAMILTAFVFLHLIATCAAIGTIVITDMRLMARLWGYRVVIPPPERFETVMIMASLVLLYVTGAVLVFLGMADNPSYLDNGKLQGKLVLVGLLTANAFVLHYRTFPILVRSQPVSGWSRVQWLTLASSFSLSNSMWFYCAFLGIARPWNFTVTVGFVLMVGLLVWALVFVLANAVLKLASRDAPKEQPDWVDVTITTLSDLSRLSDAAGPTRAKTKVKSGVGRRDAPVGNPDHLL